MQKARRHTGADRSPFHRAPTACRRYGFRYYFTPFTRVLFTFPSRYWFTIGRLRVFSLGRWSSQFRTGFHVSRPTQERRPLEHTGYAYGTFTLSGRTFQTVLLCCAFKWRICRSSHLRPTTPMPQNRQAWHDIGLGCSLFARRYWGNLG